MACLGAGPIRARRHCGNHVGVVDRRHRPVRVGVGAMIACALPPPHAVDREDKQVEPNPYEPSGEAGPNALFANRTNRGTSILYGLGALPFGTVVGGMIGGLLADPVFGQQDKNVVLTAILYGAIAGAVFVLGLLAWLARRTGEWTQFYVGVAVAMVEATAIGCVIILRWP